jgi:hypothetical protein
MVRDNAIASLFDGSTVVNLHAISLQFRHLAEHFARAYFRATEELDSRLESIFATAAPLPAFNPKKLELHNRGRNDLLQGLGSSLSQLYGLRAEPAIDGEVLESIIALTNVVVGEISALYKTLGELTAEQYLALDRSAELYDLSKQYCALHAAAACVQMWIHNRNHSGEFFAKGEWLVLGLDRLLTTFDPSRALVPSPYLANLARELETRCQQNTLSFFARSN